MVVRQHLTNKLRRYRRASIEFTKIHAAELTELPFLGIPLTHFDKRRPRWQLSLGRQPRTFEAIHRPIWQALDRWLYAPSKVGATRAAINEAVILKQTGFLFCLPVEGCLLQSSRSHVTDRLRVDDTLASMKKLVRDFLSGP